MTYAPLLRKKIGTSASSELPTNGMFAARSASSTRSDASSTSRSSCAYGTLQARSARSWSSAAAMPRAERIVARDRLFVAAKIRNRLREHVLDVRVHPHRREHAPRDRAEEGLGDLTIVAVDDERRVQPLDLFPGRHIGGERAELAPHFVERAQHVRAVERESRRGVVLGTDPVTPLESVAHAARDLGEVRAECVERIRNRRCRARRLPRCRSRAPSADFAHWHSLTLEPNQHDDDHRT